MKIIDLLNRIANNDDVPRMIKYQHNIYIYIGNYMYQGYKKDGLILKICIDAVSLNEEVEIIEESKEEIEKLYLEEKENILIDDLSIFQHSVHKSINNIEHKINEIIDYINKKDSQKS